MRSILVEGEAEYSVLMAQTGFEEAGTGQYPKIAVDIIKVGKIQVAQNGIRQNYRIFRVSPNR
jgi:hypothetical protein